MFKKLKEGLKTKLRRKVAAEAHKRDLTNLSEDIMCGYATVINTMDLLDMYKDRMYTKEYNRVAKRCGFDKDSSIPEEVKNDIITGFMTSALMSGCLTENYELVKDYIK